MAEDCIFCKIGSGEIKSDILYRDDNCFVIRDIAPRAPVHFLVIPCHHIPHPPDLTPERYQVIGGMFKAAEEMARREGVGSTGYRIVINQGSDAGQDVDHLHLHVLAGRPLGAMG